jgi:hypothetical protein
MIKATNLVHTAVLLALAAGAASARANHDSGTLAVVMTNSPTANQILVFDTGTKALLQTLSTRGLGGASGNARGVKQLNGDLVAVVNYGSNSVSLFKRDGNRLRLDQIVATSSAPVSIDFGNHHMYVAGATTVDSFEMSHGDLWRDGSATLRLVGGAFPAAGSTAQVGVLNKNEDNLDNSLRLMAPFYRVFANTLGDGPWFDTYIQNIPPVPSLTTGGGVG